MASHIPAFPTDLASIREWISDAVEGDYPSFFAYWKQVSKRIY